MAGPRAELAALKKSVAEFEAQFLTPYLAAPTLGTPKRREVLHVAAYVVLAHGALENFVEGLALWALAKIVRNWTARRRAGRCTASALLYHTVPTIGDSSPATIYDNLREALANANRTLSLAIRENNGITPRHLKQLFYPLGVDLPNNPVLTASVESLVKMRHFWAHQYRHGGAAVIKTASDAKVAVGDCLKFAEELADQASSAHP